MLTAAEPSTYTVSIPFSVDQILNRLWGLCDEDWRFDAASDQWWHVKATCPHGEFVGKSRGQIDLSSAFAQIWDAAHEAHQE